MAGLNIRTYGCQRAEEGWSRPAQSLYGRLLDNHCQDGIGEVYSCSFRSSKTLPIQLRHCRLHHLENWDGNACDLAAFSFWPQDGRRSIISFRVNTFVFVPFSFSNFLQSAATASLTSSGPGTAEIYHILVLTN